MNNNSDVSPVDISGLISALCRSRSNTPSTSDTFVDSNFVEDCVTDRFGERTTATLLQIENAVGICSPDSANQTKSLAAFLAPLLNDLRESGLLERLITLHEKLNPGEKSILKNDDNTIFLRLQPVIELLERADLPKDIFDILPAYASGAAGHAFTSALRYGACLELVNQIIAGTAATHPNGDSIAICEVPRLGKIRAWQFDPDARSGSLFVDDMKVDRYTFRYDDTEGIVKATLIEQWSYCWAIEIAKEGYTLAKRDTQRDFLARLQNDPNADPFVNVDPPGSSNRPALPAEAKDFLNPDSIWGRGLTGRLFAQGTDIAIKSVTGKRYAMKTVAQAGATAVFDTIYTALDGQEYLRDHIFEGNVVFGPNHSMLKISEDSCIDIMFALTPSGEFPTAIGEFPDTQRGWCMGRCSPLIANSR